MILFNSFIALLIAVFGSYIGYQQYLLNKKMVKLNSQNLKWNLFEKRYKIYHLTKEILLKITQDNTIDPVKLRDYNFSIRERVFLFENDINEYIQTMTENGISISNSTDKLKKEFKLPEATEEYKRLIESNLNLSRWFTFEYQENVETRFMKYLNFQDLI